MDEHHPRRGRGARAGDPPYDPPYGFPDARGSASILAAFLDSLASRRTGELGPRAEELLSDASFYDPVGAMRLRASLEVLIRALAPWLGNPVQQDAGHGQSESSLRILDPNAPGGVRYELDSTSGPELIAVLDELKYANRYRARGAQPPTRILLEGPAGCGKTEAVTWLARGLDRKVAVVMLSKLISKWVGETGARFLSAVDEARELGAVLLIDEVDAVGTHRTEGQHSSHASQVVGAVNQVLDDARNSDLLIVAATNLPDSIDPAVSRRLGTRIRFGYPDAKTRERIAGHHWRQAPVADEALDALVARTEGRSGDALVRAANAANRSAGRRGNAAAEAIKDDPNAVADAIRAAACDGPVSAELGLRVAVALAELAEAAAKEIRDGRGTRAHDARKHRGLLVELSRIEVGDVIAAIAGLTREVPLDREPSRIILSGATRKEKHEERFRIKD